MTATEQISYKTKNLMRNIANWALVIMAFGLVLSLLMTWAFLVA